MVEDWNDGFADARGSVLGSGISKSADARSELSEEEEEDEEGGSDWKGGMVED